MPPGNIYGNEELVIEDATYSFPDGKGAALIKENLLLSGNRKMANGNSFGKSGIQIYHPNNKKYVMKNAINWFEIPTTDIDRAQKFYETIFQFEMASLNFEEIKMRMFPLDNPMDGVGGTLVQTDGFHKPSVTDGPLIYLNGNPDLQIILNRVEAAGGKVLVPKRTISDEYGDMGVFQDTEGNRIALHNVPAKYLNL